MTPTFEVDPPLEPDLEQRLIDIWAAVTNAGGAVGFVPPVTTADIAPVADEAFGRVRRGGDHLIVAGIDGVVAGFLFLEKRSGPLFSHWATIKRLQVDPAYQGRGLGRALLEEAHRAAPGLGLEQLHLTVRGGTGLERFYQDHGYELIARIPEMIRLRPGEDRDELYLIKHL